MEYFRHDFPEMAWPKPMPDPPGTKKLSALRWKDQVEVWRGAFRQYAEGWRWYNGEPEEVRANREAEERAAMGGASDRADHFEGPEGTEVAYDDGTSFKDELGKMVKVGQQVGWRRQIQHFYQTRGAAYRDAMKEFVAGYKEGVKEAATPPKREEEDKVPLNLDASKLESNRESSQGKGDAQPREGGTEASPAKGITTR